MIICILERIDSSKKSLTDKNTEYELVLLDATETPCERPKKNRKNSIVERKSATL